MPYYSLVSLFCSHLTNECNTNVRILNAAQDRNNIYFCVYFQLVDNFFRPDLILAGFLP